MKNNRTSTLFLVAFFLMASPIWAEDRISVPSPRDEVIELLRQQVSVLQEEVTDLRLENTDLRGRVELWQSINRYGLRSESRRAGRCLDPAGSRERWLEK